MMPKRTLNMGLLQVLLAATVALGLARAVPVTGQDAGSPVASQDADARIENAMSAAPSDIAAAATVLDNELDDSGTFVVLREGSNGWSCFPTCPARRGMIPPATTKRGWTGTTRSWPMRTRPSP